MQASGPLSAGHVLQLFEDVVGRVVDDVGLAVLRSHQQPLGLAIDRDHASGAEHPGAANGELPDRPAAPHRDGVARRMLQFSAAM